MEEVNHSMEFLPMSISTRLVTYEPIPIIPPKKGNFQRTKFETKVKSIPKSHQLQKPFQPYLRATRYTNKNTYKKHKSPDFDASVERQNQFLHDSPRNIDYKTSRMPDFDSIVKVKDRDPGFKLSRAKRKVESVKFPPLLHGYFQKFDLNLSGLSISSSRVKAYDV